MDGDTVRLNIEVEPGLWRKNQLCRLIGIDAPELPSEAGKSAKAALVGLLVPSGKAPLLRLEMHGRDRYGRWLILLFAGELSVNDWLVEHGHAKPR